MEYFLGPTDIPKFDCFCLCLQILFIWIFFFNMVTHPKSIFHQSRPYIYSFWQTYPYQALRLFPALHLFRSWEYWSSRCKGEKHVGCLWGFFHILIQVKWILWHYLLWSFKTRDTKLERFLHKNQRTQRKLLNFDNWTNGEPQ